MNIDLYSENDCITDILSIDKQAVEDFYYKIKNIYNQDDLLNINEHYFNKNGLFKVGKIDGKIVGTCGYIPIDSKSVELKRLRIRKDLRGYGYGSLLLESIEDCIKSNGFSLIKFTTASIRKKTISFYKNRGYLEVGKYKYDQLETIAFEKAF